MEFGYKCVCLNARSIVNKRNELNIMIEDIDLHIIGITKCWATTDISDAELGITARWPSGQSAGRPTRMTRVRVPVPASWLFGNDTATVSKLGQFRSPYIACPFQPASAEGQANNTSKQSTTVPSGTERVHDQGGGSGQLGLRAKGAKNLWVKEPPKEGKQTAAYNVRTLLRDEHIQ